MYIHLSRRLFFVLEHIKSKQFQPDKNISNPLIVRPFIQPSLTRNVKHARNYHTELLYSQKWKSKIQILRIRSGGTLFVKEHSDSKSKYNEEDIIKMLEFLIDNISVVFAGKVFKQIVGIPIGKIGVPLLADIVLHSYEADLYSYEAELIQFLLSACKKQ